MDAGADAWCLSKFEDFKHAVMTHDPLTPTLEAFFPAKEGAFVQNMFPIQISQCIRIVAPNLEL